MALQDTFLVYQNLTSTIWYKVQVKSGVCPIQNSNQVTLTVVVPTQSDAGSDKSIVQYHNTTLSGTGSGNASWQPSSGLDNPLSFMPTASPVNSTTYTLTVTDHYGCVTKDSVFVEVIILIPTAITPNGDGVNDYFIIDKIKDFPSNSLKIVDRWGAVVYKAAPYNNDWNGVGSSRKDLPDDIYYIEFDYGNGTKEVVSSYLLIKR